MRAKVPSSVFRSGGVRAGSAGGAPGTGAAGGAVVAGWKVARLGSGMGWVGAEVGPAEVGGWWSGDSVG